jgi:hypothetical protein
MGRKPRDGTPYNQCVLITLRVTRAERAQLNQSASREGLSLQDLIYNRVFDAEDDEEMQTCPWCGFIHLGGPESCRPPTPGPRPQP